jgi:hypothetical protein
MCLILQYITICTTTNQAKTKRTNIYDGGVMIFLNDPLIILLWETLIEKLMTKIWFCPKSLANYYIFVYTHFKELRKVMGEWGSLIAHYCYFDGEGNDWTFCEQHS